MWKIADLVNWPVQGRRQWLQRRCQSEIDIAGIVQQTSGCLLLPWHSEPERIKRSQHSASEDQPHDFVAGRGSMQCGYLHIAITAPSLSMWKRSLRKDKRRRTTIEDGSKRRAAEGLGGEFRSRCAVRIRQMFTPQSVRHASKIRIRFRFLLETTEAVVPEITLASGQSSRTTGSQNPVDDGFEGREPSFQERHGDG
jgi:hypothetical protein